MNDLVERLRAQVTSNLYGGALSHHPVCIEAANALETQASQIDTLKHKLDAVREGLRVTMLAQPTTGERTTYSDGFFQGLCFAIGRIDAALEVSDEPKS